MSTFFSLLDFLRRYFPKSWPEMLERSRVEGSKWKFLKCRECGCITEELSTDELCARCCVEKFYPNGFKGFEKGNIDK